MSDLARHLIEREKRDRTGTLDLGNCGLTELPDLSELDWLETLIVSNEWWDWEKREVILSQNPGEPNQIAAPPAHPLPVNLKKVVFVGDYFHQWSIGDGSFLGKLTNLTTLYIGYNEIADGAFLENLTNLTLLDLRSFQISDWSYLKYLTNLTTLGLTGDEINNGAFLKNLTNLTSLYLNSSQISDWSFLEKLTNLTSLDIYSSITSDWSFLEKLTNLTSLDLSYHKISDGTFLENLTNLTSLNLSNNELSDGAFLENLTNLTSLDLRSNQISSEAFLEKLTNLTTLYLEGNQISDGYFLGKLTNLTTLDLGATQISDGSFLGKLTNLTTLSLSGTQISDWSFLGKLTNLTTLSLNSTKISNGAFIENLANLTSLYLNSTQFNDGALLGKLTNLTTLDLRGNKISDGAFLENLTNLTSLYLYGNQINNGVFIEKLTHLTSLDLGNNQIGEVAFLEKLTQLEALDISMNHIEDLFPILHLMQKGHQVVLMDRVFPGKGEINVYGNPLTNPPIEIVKLGNEAILRHWESIAEQGAETINEAKLIIVGEGKTGKTTLFNKLIDPDYDLEKNPTDETHGINVHEGLEITPGFRANLWDFGGQDLQYMTHQFFLTPRALYVLVMEARSESPNLPYWFRIISLLGKSSSDERVSLLLVLNKRKGGTGRPQFEDLLKIYADDFDLEFLEVDFADNDKRWECLNEAIVRRLSGLPIVKNLLPKKWQSIREALRTESENRPYIGTERLHEICCEYNVTEEADQWQMTGYLHELGSLLHFQNDPDLLDTVILRPSWAVDGVYTTLKSEGIKTRNGKFSQEDIFHILRGNGYKNTDAQKILKLMSKHNFDICYHSKSGNHYVAAQLLEPDRPSLFKWHTHAGALQFRYQYAIMPKGLMSRLIVRMSDYIEVLDGTEIVWKKGAILQIPVNNSVCRVMMFEDEDSKSGLKQIAIEVLEDDDRRQNRKYALQQVRDEVEDLHRRWFQNIQFEQIIPCNCERCRTREKPFTFLLSDLQGLTKGRAFCNMLQDTVPVIQLLEGIYEPKEIQAITHSKRDQRLHGEGMAFHINIENRPHFTVTNQNTNVYQSDLAALEKMLSQLAADKKEALKNYVEMLPEPDTPEEKTGHGKSIAKWLDKNAEGIAVNVSASVYYDALKLLFGI